MVFARLPGRGVLMVALLAACNATTPGPNRTPVAVAGPDRTCLPGDSVMLDGSASYDPDGDELAGSRWQLTVAPDGSRATVTAVADDPRRAILKTDVAGLYLVELLVNDGRIDSRPDVVSVLARGGCRSDVDCGPCQACQPDGSCQEDLGRDQSCPPCHVCVAGQGCQPAAAGSDPRNDCDDGLFCNGDETCDGEGGCRQNEPPCPPPLGCDEQADTCTGCQNNDQCGRCQKCDASSHVCVEQQAGNDLKEECPSGPCLTGACDGQGDCGMLEPGSDCDDGDPCNGTDSCDAAGQCSRHAGSPCPETPCNTCQPDGSCLDPAGTPCGQAAECAGQGTCDGAGTCNVQLDDAYCQAQDPQSVCLPACAPHSSGCLVPPRQAVLLCNPEQLQTGEASSCTLTLTGGETAGQEDCLQCRAALAPQQIAGTDFDDGAGQCDLGGWQLVPGASGGNNCNDSLAFPPGTCSPAAGAKDCCDELEKICTSELGGWALHQDKATACGNKHEEWRLEREFDFTGRSAVSVCFAVAHQASDDKDGLILDARDDGGNSQVLYCFRGGPGAGPQDTFQRVCVGPLDSWANDNPAVTLRFIVHSEGDGHKIFLDDVSVWGYGGGCLPSRRSISETFAGNDPGPCAAEGWDGTVQQCASFTCSNQGGWEPGIEADQETTTISKHFDFSALDGWIEICAGLGWDGSAAGDFFSLRLDAGSGMHDILRLEGPLGVDQHCRRFCTLLAREREPEATNNPDVLLEINLGSSSGKVTLFWLEISGVQFCPAAGTVNISELTGDGLGNYDFTVSAPQALDARLRCQWLGAEPRAQGWLSFR